MNFFKRNKVAIFLVCLGIIAIAIGVFRGEDQTIFRKAVNICMECIGLG